MAAAKAVGHLPRTFARVAHVSPGRMATALSARYIGECMVQQVASMITYADRIVAVCQWLYDALVINGVPREKLVLSRQGVASEVLSTLTAVRAAERRVGGPLRLLALGRWDPVKGLDLAVRAILALPREAPVVLKIHGIPVVGAGEYEMRTRHLAEGDTRICIEGPLPHERIAEAFADSDVLLAPSNWLETGPLTVLEAQAAGLFVLGSRRGGIAELVDEPNGGWLLEPDDVGIWSDALAKLVEIHSHSKLSVSSGSLRTMTAAAADMIELYRSL
jgi:glycosyltransferase involved in cell wall biosynthesis